MFISLPMLVVLLMLLGGCRCHEPAPSRRERAAARESAADAWMLLPTKPAPHATLQGWLEAGFYFLVTALFVLAVVVLA
jgi:hypothetical protein